MLEGSYVVEWASTFIYGLLVVVTGHVQLSRSSFTTHTHINPHTHSNKPNRIMLQYGLKC
jgi:hypothetical protein